jgi:hypothetical protein
MWRPRLSIRDLKSVTKPRDFNEIRYTNSLQKKLPSKHEFRENRRSQSQFTEGRKLISTHDFHVY